MGYRLLVAVCALSLLSACAAFDSDNEPYAGFNPSEVPAPVGAGESQFTGYYTGSMTLDTNECETVASESGSQSTIGIDVVHSDETINATFEDDATVAGTLEGDKVTLMKEGMGLREIYYLTFVMEEGAEEASAVDGSMELFEATAEGAYKQPCASYTLTLEKGEKPAADEESSEEEADQSDESEEEGAIRLSFK